MKITQRQLHEVIRSVINEKLDTTWHRSDHHPLHAMDEKLDSFQSYIEEMNDVVESLPESKQKKQLQRYVSDLEVFIYDPLKGSVDALNVHFEVTEKKQKQK